MAEAPGCVSLSAAAYLWGDAALRDRVRLGFDRALREAAVDYSTPVACGRADVATSMLRLGQNFDQAFKLRYYPMILAAGRISDDADDDVIVAECRDVITALAEGPPETVDSDG